MGFNISELVQGSKYKNFMKYLYGWGASIVLTGALFKLQHWTGAGIMLTVGMLTEAIIFFFSAFEPIVEEVDWSIVYPELAGITDQASAGRSSQGGGMDPGMLESVITSALSKSSLNIGGFAGLGGPVTPEPAPAPAPAPAPTPAPAAAAAPVMAGGMVFTEKFNEMLEKAEIGPELFVNIGHGLDRLSEASNGIARISDAVAASETFSRNMQRAGGAVGKFAESYENTGALVARTAQVLSQSFEGTAASIGETGKNFAQGVQEIVQKMGAQLTEASNAVGQGVSEAGQHLQGLNKNIEALNAAHELQVKNVEARMKESDALSAGVEDLMKRLAKTVEDSQKYSQSVAQLTDNVSQLNAIYGNMLSAMGSMMGGK